MKYAVKVEHKDLDTIKVQIIEYKKGLDYLHEHCDCNCIDIINPRAYFKEIGFPQYMRFVDLVIDDEGKLTSKYPTFPVYSHDGKLADLIVGSMLFINGNPETGSSYGLNHEHAILIAEWALNALGLYTKFNVQHDIPELSHIIIDR